ANEGEVEFAGGQAGFAGILGATVHPPTCLMSAFDAELPHCRGIRGQFAGRHPFGEEAVFLQNAPSTCRIKAAKDHLVRATLCGVAASRHMFIALCGARPKIMHEVQRPPTMPVHPERIEFLPRTLKSAFFVRSLPCEYR